MTRPARRQPLGAAAPELNRGHGEQRGELAQEVLGEDLHVAGEDEQVDPVEQVEDLALRRLLGGRFDRHDASQAEAVGLPFHHIPVEPATKEAVERQILDLLDGIDLLVLARQHGPRQFPARARAGDQLHAQLHPALVGAVEGVGADEGGEEAVVDVHRRRGELAQGSPRRGSACSGRGRAG